MQTSGRVVAAPGDDVGLCSVYGCRKLVERGGGNVACCCGQDESGRQKHKPRTPEQVKSLVTRLNRIDGQILGIKKMIEENRYCPDVLMQVSAVQSSLNSFNKELLATHIKTCVVDDIREGKEEAVDELCELLKKTMK